MIKIPFRQHTYSNIYQILRFTFMVMKYSNVLFHTYMYDLLTSNFIYQ